MTVDEFVNAFISEDDCYSVRVTFSLDGGTFFKYYRCKRGSEHNDPFLTFLLSFHVLDISAVEDFDYDSIPLITVKEHMAVNTIED